MEVVKFVCRDHERKYYRFRFTRHYGGIATADCVGCNLKCFFCWSFRPRDNYKKYGRFYSPEEVAKKLVLIASEKGVRRIRISGNEPTLCREHLLEVLRNIPKNYLFILETNGTLIDQEFAESLSSFENLHVRVSLKSPTPEKFERITRFEKRGFFLQIRALEVLEENGISYHPAIMYELITSREEFERLLEYLVNINPDLPSRLEFEYLQVLPPLREKILWGIREGLIRPPKVG